jgi:hypothetical protein
MANQGYDVVVDVDAEVRLSLLLLSNTSAIHCRVFEFRISGSMHAKVLPLSI